jgi:predicted dehydrogenase
MALKIAFYGAGARAQPYLQVLARQPAVRVTAVCDVDRRAAEQVAAGWEARVFLSYEAMLQEARPEALWICVAPHLQGDVLLKAVEMRIPFLVEPPGAVDHERARQYARLVAEANLVTAVGFTSRYSDVVREAREYLGDGTVPLALGSWLRPAEGEGPAQTATRLLWAEASGLVDALRFFCGEVVRVRALSAGAGETPGGLVAHLEFANGSVGALTCAGFARAEPRVELELLGEGWTLGFGEGFASLRLAEGDKITILRRQNNPAAELTKAFLEAILARKPEMVPTGYAEVLPTLTACQAISDSVMRGQPVPLQEMEG